MAFKLHIKPIVLIDADEAIVYYERRQTGLGKRFYTHMFTAFEQLQTNPYNYLLVKEPVRRILIAKFPYKIFFFIEDEIIIVIGVSHAKRSNAFVKRRLRLLE